MSTTTSGVTAAPDLGDVLPARKARGKIGMFIHRHPTIFVGGLLLFIIFCIGIFAPFLGTVDPTALAPARRTRPPPDVFAWGSYWLDMGPKPPAVQFIFGSDMLGRDVYSRVLYGTQISLLVGFSVAVVASVIGLFIGLTSGFIRSVDTVVLSLREQPYVEAAVAAGTRMPVIILKHILPNTLAPVSVQATFICASAMLTEATLSFIGAGTPPIIPSWGNIMAEGRALWQVKPYIVFFPAAFLSVTVLAVNLLGDGLRDALDPRLAKRI